MAMGVGGKCICKHCHANIRTAIQDAALNTKSLNTPEMLAVVLSETITSPEITVFWDTVQSPP
jgi:glutamate-1-semialdehyde aminotransferase